MVGRAELQRTVVLVVALLVTAGATAAFAREFRAADTQNEAYPTVQALRFMGRQITERTGGRHEIKVFHSRLLGEEKETLDQTRAGAIDLNRINVALIGNIVPTMNVLALPFDLEEQSRKRAEAAGVVIVTDIDRKPFEAAMTGIYDKALRDPELAKLIERIRKVE